jgi:hypothetical protein
MATFCHNRADLLHWTSKPRHPCVRGCNFSEWRANCGRQGCKNKILQIGAVAAYNDAYPANLQGSCKCEYLPKGLAHKIEFSLTLSLYHPLHLILVSHCPCLTLSLPHPVPAPISPCLTLSLPHSIPVSPCPCLSASLPHHSVPSQASSHHGFQS